MLDDFLVRALLAGVGLALVAGPLGCFIVWRRLAYFGDALSHAAILGVACAFLLDLPLLGTVFGVSIAFAMVFLFLEKRVFLSSDVVIGLCSHGFLALGLVLLGFATWLQVDVGQFLWGDVLTVSKTDLFVIYTGSFFILCVLFWIWSRLVALTVSEELARAEGVNVLGTRIIFAFLIAGVVAMAMKIVGALLISAILIIPAATARLWAAGPERMAALASALGVISVSGGLWSSFAWDLPSGPAIIVAAFCLFLASFCVSKGFERLARRV